MKQGINAFVNTNVHLQVNSSLGAQVTLAQLENITQRFTTAFGKLRVVKLLSSIGTVLNTAEPLAMTQSLNNMAGLVLTITQSRKNTQPRGLCVENFK